MILSVENGNFSYDNKRKILENINLKCYKSSVLSILGPNGVGKTTLLKCILGLLKWKSGDSFFENKNIKNISTKEFFKNVSYVPQVHSFSFSYTALEIVLMGLSGKLNIFSSPSKKDVENAKNIMEKIKILHLSDKNIDKISGGELQMVLIAKALITNPKLIVFDEVETGLDFYNQILVLNLIKKLVKEENLSVIINTHYPTNALRISDYTFMMSKENKHIYGKTLDVINPKNIKEIFKVDSVVDEIKYNEKTFKNLFPIDIEM